MNGQGVYSSADGSIYEGEYKDGEKNGHGVYKNASGGFYEGEYKNDKRNGQGVYKWADDSEFKGQFFNDEIKGQGQYIDSKTGKQLEGSNFKQDKIKNELSGREEIRLWEGEKLVKTLVMEDEKWIIKQNNE